MIALWSVVLFSVLCDAYFVHKLAGKKFEGSSDGFGDDAGFFGPSLLAMGPNNMLFIADFNNHCIRQMRLCGAVATFAGFPQQAGSTDGFRSQARFNGPTGIAVTSVLDAFVTEYLGHRIRKIDVHGTVSTILGDGTAGYREGTGTSAQLNGPMGIAVLSSNVLIFADRFNHRIRRLTISTRQVELLVGSGHTEYQNGAGSEASLQHPAGVVVAPGGVIYFTEIGGHRVRKITAGNVVSDLVGSQQSESGLVNGIGSSARFNSSFGITINSQGTHLAVADTYNNAVRLIEIATRSVSTLAGNGQEGLQNGDATSAQFSKNQGIVAASHDFYVVADSKNNQIRLLTPFNDMRCTISESMSQGTESLTLSESEEVTRSPSLTFSFSLSRTASKSGSFSLSPTTSTTLSVSFSISISKTRSLTLSTSQSRSLSPSFSFSRTNSFSYSVSDSPTASFSLTLSLSHSFSQSHSSTVTLSPTITASLSASWTSTSSATTSNSLSASGTVSASGRTFSEDPTATASASLSVSLSARGCSLALDYHHCFLSFPGCYFSQLFQHCVDRSVQRHFLPDSIDGIFFPSAVVAGRALTVAVFGGINLQDSLLVLVPFNETCPTSGDQAWAEGASNEWNSTIRADNATFIISNPQHGVFHLCFTQNVSNAVVRRFNEDVQIPLSPRPMLHYCAPRREKLFVFDPFSITFVGRDFTTDDGFAVVPVGVNCLDVKNTSFRPMKIVQNQRSVGTVEVEKEGTYRVCFTSPGVAPHSCPFLLDIRSNAPWKNEKLLKFYSEIDSEITLTSVNEVSCRSLSIIDQPVEYKWGPVLHPEKFTALFGTFNTPFTPLESCALLFRPLDSPTLSPIGITVWFDASQFDETVVVELHTAVVSRKYESNRRSASYTHSTTFTNPHNGRCFRLPGYDLHSRLIFGIEERSFVQEVFVPTSSVLIIICSPSWYGGGSSPRFGAYRNGSLVRSIKEPQDLQNSQRRRTGELCFEKFYFGTGGQIVYNQPNPQCAELVIEADSKFLSRAGPFSVAVQLQRVSLFELLNESCTLRTIEFQSEDGRELSRLCAASDTVFFTPVLAPSKKIRVILGPFVSNVSLLFTAVSETCPGDVDASGYTTNVCSNRGACLPIQYGHLLGLIPTSKRCECDAPFAASSYDATCDSCDSTLRMDKSSFPSCRANGCPYECSKPNGACRTVDNDGITMKLCQCNNSTVFGPGCVDSNSKLEKWSRNHLLALLPMAGGRPANAFVPQHNVDLTYATCELDSRCIHDSYGGLAINRNKLPSQRPDYILSVVNFKLEKVLTITMWTTMQQYSNGIVAAFVDSNVTLSRLIRTNGRMDFLDDIILKEQNGRVSTLLPGKVIVITVNANQKRFGVVVADENGGSGGLKYHISFLRGVPPQLFDGLQHHVAIGLGHYLSPRSAVALFVDGQEASVSCIPYLPQLQKPSLLVGYAAAMSIKDFGAWDVRLSPTKVAELSHQQNPFFCSFTSPAAIILYYVVPTLIIFEWIAIAFFKPLNHQLSQLRKFEKWVADEDEFLKQKSRCPWDRINTEVTVEEEQWPTEEEIEQRSSTTPVAIDRDVLILEDVDGEAISDDSPQDVAEIGVDSREEDDEEEEVEEENVALSPVCIDPQWRRCEEEDWRELFKSLASVLFTEEERSRREATNEEAALYRALVDEFCKHGMTIVERNEIEARNTIEKRRRKRAQDLEVEAERLRDMYDGVVVHEANAARNERLQEDLIEASRRNFQPRLGAGGSGGKKKKKKRGDKGAEP